MINDTILESCKNYNKNKTRSFSCPNADKVYLEPVGLSREIPDGFLDDPTLLSKEEEFKLFQALHYVKYRITKLADTRAVKTYDRYLSIWKAIRSRLVAANLGLIYRCIKSLNAKHLAVELQSEGLVYLLMAVDSFDPWRDNKMGGHIKFCTYAMTAIIRAMYSIFKKGRDQQLENENQAHEISHEQILADNSVFINAMMEALQSDILKPNELDLIKWRFGLRNSKHEVQETMTLGEIGEIRSLSKERIRQLETEALRKIANYLKDEPVFAEWFKNNQCIILNENQSNRTANALL